jgi:hypothetical protein
MLYTNNQVHIRHIYTNNIFSIVHTGFTHKNSLLYTSVCVDLNVSYAIIVNQEFKAR